MTRVLLLHGGQIPHYRVPVYNYLSRYLRERAFDLTLMSEAVQPGNPTAIEFPYVEVPISAGRVGRLMQRGQYDVLIVFVNMRHWYLFPVYAVAKGILRKRMIWWGQGRDLLDPNSRLKNTAYALEHLLCDAILLYAEHLRKYVARRFQHKVFVANNTLAIDYPGLPVGDREPVLRRHGIHTRKNIICVGRFEKRKRLDHLIAALRLMDRRDVGLILIGPDSDGLLKGIEDANIHWLGEIYGNERFDLLSSADVYCLPGAVGLSIVDAFHCGLPFVTEEGDESAEIAYLKPGENGLVVPRGDVPALAAALKRLLDDDGLRARYSSAARQQALGSASVERMGEGFVRALRFATRAMSTR